MKKVNVPTFTLHDITLDDAKLCVGPGWHPLLAKLYDAKPPNVQVVQVKEKFGGLRFYVDAAPKDYHDLTWAVEEESYAICEFCGDPGEMRPEGWMKTLCDKCDLVRKARPH